jgi:hypothetical protein
MTPARLARRLRLAVQAAGRGEMLYAEHGYPHAVAASRLKDIS